MKTAWILLLALASAGAAQAQNYKWVDKDGKTRYGDSPPAGVKATALRGPASGSGPAAASPGAASKDKEAAKGPLTSAEKEQDYRKRQEAARKDQEKAEQDRQAKTEKSAGCAGIRNSLRELESGVRISRVDAAGERYYLEDGQKAQEIAKSQQWLKQNCAD